MVELVKGIKSTIINSRLFPYRTGQLKNLFYDNRTLNISGNVCNVPILNNKKVLYGKILEDAPAIRYGIRKIAKARYNYRKYPNRHFKYIEKIIDKDVVSYIKRLGGELI